MSQRLIQPGLSAAGLYHPRTALPIEPIGEINGRLIWPVIGGAESDDENDSRFQDGGGADDDDDEDDSEEEDDEESEDEDDDEDDEDEKSKSKKKSKKKSKDDDDKPVYTEDEMHAVKRRMRKADQRSSRLEEELKAVKAQLVKKPKPKPKPGTESDDDTTGGVDNEELERIKKRNERLEAEVMNTKLEKAFSRVPLPEGEEWVDIEDAIAAAQRLGLLEDVIEEDGTVDRRSLRAALKDLKRRKPHLVRKVSDTDENEDEDDEEGQRPKTRRTASKMNGKRKGKDDKPDKAALARRFPVLGR